MKKTKAKKSRQPHSQQIEMMFSLGEREFTAVGYVSFGKKRITRAHILINLSDRKEDLTYAYALLESHHHYLIRKEGGQTILSFCLMFEGFKGDASSKRVSRMPPLIIDFKLKGRNGSSFSGECRESRGKSGEVTFFNISPGFKTH